MYSACIPALLQRIGERRRGAGNNIYVSTDMFSKRVQDPAKKGLDLNMK